MQRKGHDGLINKEGKQNKEAEEDKGNRDQGDSDVVPPGSTQSTIIQQNLASEQEADTSAAP